MLMNNALCACDNGSARSLVTKDVTLDAHSKHSLLDVDNKDDIFHSDRKLVMFDSDKKDDVINV